MFDSSIDQRRYLVLRNVVFQQESLPKAGFSLMAFVCYWIQKNVNSEEIRPWFDIQNAMYLGSLVGKRYRQNKFSKRYAPYHHRPIKSKSPPILIQFTSAEKAEATLRGFLEKEKYHRSGGETLEPFQQSQAERDAFQVIKNALRTFQSLGHGIRVQIYPEMKIILDQQFILTVHEGKLISKPVPGGALEEDQPAGGGNNGKLIRFSLCNF